jgi:hypothetical protein
MTTDNNQDNEEKFGNDEWPEEAGPNPETEGNQEEAPQFIATKKRPNRPAKKKPGKKSEKVEDPSRPSAQDAMKVLQAQMQNGGPIGNKGQKGKFSIGKGGLNSPFIICLVGAIIALVISVGVCTYLAPNRNQFTTLTNEHNLLNSSVINLQAQVNTKASSTDLGTERTRIDNQVTITTGLNSSVFTLFGDVGGLRSNISEIQAWKLGIVPSQYVKVLDTYNLGGNSSDSINGTLVPVLNQMWTNWHGLPSNLSLVRSQVADLTDSYDPNSSFSFGGNTSGNYSGNLSGALNKFYSNWFGLNQSVSNISTEVNIIKDQIFDIGNCSDCNISQVLQYLYDGSRNGSW